MRTSQIIAQSTRAQRIRMAESPKTNPETLRALAKSANEATRFRIARNASTPHEVLNDLINDKCDAIADAAFREICRRVR